MAFFKDNELAYQELFPILNERYISMFCAKEKQITIYYSGKTYSILEIMQALGPLTASRIVALFVALFLGGSHMLLLFTPSQSQEKMLFLIHLRF